MLVGAGSSHFVAVANALRVAKGFLTAPVYLDAEQLVDGSHSVGLLHMANLGEGQVAEKVCRRAAVALAQASLCFVSSRLPGACCALTLSAAALLSASRLAATACQACSPAHLPRALRCKGSTAAG